MIGSLLIEGERLEIEEIRFTKGAIWLRAFTGSTMKRANRRSGPCLMQVYGDDGALVNETTGNVECPRYGVGSSVRIDVCLYWPMKPPEEIPK
jgi:hypothetical protein